MLAALGHTTNAHTECTANGIQRVDSFDSPLTNSDLDGLCPDWESNPSVKIQHATHCGANPEKTAWLIKSIKNQLFGGNPNPPFDSASMNFTDPYDCTAHCVKNTEGRGHFKYKPGANCFQYRGTGMCGVEAEQAYALERASHLCDGVCVLDEPTCIDTSGYHIFDPISILSNDYTVSYDVTFDVFKEQNVLMSGWTSDWATGLYWNNYYTWPGPGAHRVCLDGYCVADDGISPDLSPDVEYHVKLHYHDSVLDFSVCESDGENCRGSTNISSLSINVETNVQFMTAWWDLDRAAEATLCNFKIVDHDYQGSFGSDRVARASIIPTDNKHKRTDCEACVHAHPPAQP